MKNRLILLATLLVVLFAPLHAKSEAYFSPKDNIEEKIITLINKASTNSSISIAIYQLTSQKIATALCNALKRGAKITIITDHSTYKTTTSKITLLRNEGAEIFVFVPATSYTGILKPLMHNKFALFDFNGKEQILETGSFNWTKSANDLNCENITITSNKKLYTAYKNYYEELRRQCKNKKKKELKEPTYSSNGPDKNDGMLQKITSFLQAVRKALGNNQRK